MVHIRKGKLTMSKLEVLDYLMRAGLIAKSGVFDHTDSELEVLMNTALEVKGLKARVKVE